MAVLEKRYDNVEVHGGEVCEQAFNIHASAEAFEILSDRIYPNKVKAVVRELSTNAVDATIDARKVSRVHQLLNIDPNTHVTYIANDVKDNVSYVEREVETFNNNVKYDLSDWVERAPLVRVVDEPPVISGSGGEPKRFDPSHPSPA